MISKMKFGKSSCTHTLFLPEVNDSSLKNVYISDINKKIYITQNDDSRDLVKFMTFQIVSPSHKIKHEY